MHPLIKQLLEKKIVVTDGSWGTQLQRRGLLRGECPDGWNLSHPEKVEDVARQYAEAGSDIILTNTFGANRIVLEKQALADRSVAINEAGVAISKRGAAGKALVFASIGPSGKLLAMKNVSAEELREAFEEQAEAQARAGADGIVVETMMDLGEARIAVAAAKKTGLPVVASMVFDAGKNRDRTMMGHTPEEAVRELLAAGADVVGANCGQGIEGFLPVCRKMRSVTDAPLWMKPNAGLPEIAGGETVYRTTAADFGRFVPDLVRGGANFIGGCCGTDRDFIIEIKKIVSGLK